MNESNKKIIYSIIGGIIIFCALYIASSYHQHIPIESTIHSITENNRQARKYIKCAGSQLDSSTKHIDNAEKRIDCGQQRLGKVQKGVTDNERKIKQSKDLIKEGRRNIAEERRVLEEAERGN